MKIGGGIRSKESYVAMCKTGLLQSPAPLLPPVARRRMTGLCRTESNPSRDGLTSIHDEVDSVFAGLDSIPDRPVPVPGGLASVGDGVDSVRV